MLRVLALLFFVALSGATFAANDWVNMLAADPTGGLVTGHACYSTNGHDVSCDAGAPTITSGTLYVATSISSTNGYFGTVSATTFYGDGSHLTNISASAVSGLSSDRIVSGTGNSVGLIANSNTNIISITSAGVVGGYFNSNGVLTAPGISATANLTSVTTLYASGNVGVGVAAPSAKLEVNGAVSGTSLLTSYGTSTNGNLHWTLANGGGTRFGLGLLNTESGTNTGSNFGIWRYDDSSSLLGAALFIRRSDGQVGIGTASPGAALEVNGTISASNVYVTGTTGAVSATYGYFTYISATNGLSNASGDRIVSGSLLAVANSATGYISLTTGATNWGYLSSGQSFIPAVGANTVSSTLVSATNVSVTTSHYNSTTVTNIAGGGGNYIVSGTASVSTTTAGGGNINFSANNTLAMTISATNVGIGTAAPAFRLSVASSVAKATAGTTNIATFSSSDANGSSDLGLIVRMGGSATAGSRWMGLQSNENGSGPRYLILQDTGSNVGIGTTSPGATLDVNGDIRGSNFFPSGAGFVNLGGASTLVCVTYQATYTGFYTMGYCTGSDRRLKTNIQDMTSENGLAAIEQLKTVSFNWKDEQLNKKDGPQIGFIAQDVEKIFPQFVSKNGPSVIELADGREEKISNTLAIDYGKLVVPLVKAVQELKAQNDDLRARIEKLEAARHD